MTFIDERHEILRKIVQQTERSAPRLPSVEITRIIFDARAIAEFIHHFYVELHSLFQSLRLERPPLGDEKVVTDDHVVLNVSNRLLHAILGRHEDVRRIDSDLLRRVYHYPVDWVEHFYLFQLLAPENKSTGIVAVSHVNVHRIAQHPERPALELGLVARVQRIDERKQQLVATHSRSHRERDRIVVKILGIAYAVETRNRRYHHDVPSSRKERGGRVQSETFYFLVDLQVLFDVRVRMWDIGFGLIIVIVRNEILHGVLREKTFELAVQLRRQRFVVAQHQ